MKIVGLDPSSSSSSHIPFYHPWSSIASPQILILLNWLGIFCYFWSIFDPHFPHFLQDKKSICNKFQQTSSVTCLTWPGGHPNEAQHTEPAGGQHGGCPVPGHFQWENELMNSIFFWKLEWSLFFLKVPNFTKPCQMWRRMMCNYETLERHDVLYANSTVMWFNQMNCKNQENDTNTLGRQSS